MSMSNPAIAVYDALRSVGIADDKAKLAAESIADAGNVNPIQLELRAVESKLDHKITVLQGDMKQVRWMLGFNSAMVLLVLGLLLRDIVGA